jgi:TetR/AcrR family transcriptional regulator, regulator of cefoperazone and chloramphenicol sensitivity
VPSSENAHVKVRESDLSTSARIRNAALQGFADKGVSGTTMRDVAAAAGVSTGLVQHVADNTTSLRYLARALSDGDPSAHRIFNALLTIARTQWLEPLARGGGLDPNTDAEWAALHVIIFNLATVLLEPAISAQLPEPLLTPVQLQRWNVATTELYRRGFARPLSAIDDADPTDASPGEAIEQAR